LILARASGWCSLLVGRDDYDALGKGQGAASGE
jgi:hypothetical protein